MVRWLIFTDGACENVSSVGGVLVSTDGLAIEMFGEALPESFEIEFYLESKRPIYEVELLPMALEMWGNMIDKCQLVCYLDNDAARSGLIRVSGATKVADRIVQHVCEIESQLQLKSCHARFKYV